MHAQVALQSCKSLRSILEEQQALPMSLSTMEDLCKRIHEHLILLFDFGSLLRIIQKDCLESYNSVPVNVSSAITAINNLAQSYNVSKAIIYYALFKLLTKAIMIIVRIPSRAACVTHPML